MIRSYEAPLREKAGFLVLSGNLFEGGLIKTCVISDAFREQYCPRRGRRTRLPPVVLCLRAEDYHARIDDPALGIDASCLLAIRGCGPVGYPGSAEVVNMQPPAAPVKHGVDLLQLWAMDGKVAAVRAS